MSGFAVGLPERRAPALRSRVLIVLLGLATAAGACQITNERAGAKLDSVSSVGTVEAIDSTAPAHSVRVYVSAVNCEMNSADARRINAVARSSRIHVEVIFLGVQDGERSIVSQATRDLGLEVPTRAARAGELQQYKSIGGAYLPMALVTRARQLKTIIAGETMSRTLSLIETSVSPGATP